MNVGLSVFALLFLAVGHSVLGEQSVLRPLFASEGWGLPDAPRWAAERLLRFAWHLTSVAWVVLAAIMLGAPAEIAVGGGCLVSAAFVFFGLRGHLAWPIFLLGGIAAINAGGALPGWARAGLVGMAVLVAGAAAGLHVYWAMGGRRWLDRVLPQKPDGQPIFRPGAWACLAVTACLLGYAGLVVYTSRGAPFWAWAATAVAFLVLTARAVGDGRQVGFTKTDRSTAFAQSDDAVFTPLVVVLALGAAVALLPA
ncbi:MAG: DUF3995 domain-containing protein [Myxococcota bacterium]